MKRSTSDPLKRVIVFTGFRIKLAFPKILQPHPLITLGELFSDPNVFKLDIGPTTVVENGEPVFQDRSTTESEHAYLVH